MNERPQSGGERYRLDVRNWALKLPSALAIFGECNPDLPQLSNSIIMFDPPQSKCVLRARFVVVPPLPDRQFVR
jgi:hypothetical protein